MEKYHKYVFDTENRKFVGKFEEMYRNESKEGFDSWHQEDARHIKRKFVLAVLEDYNFDFIVDVGCGKGALTHLLKKKNNKVVGIDISKTALDAAKQRYRDIDFVQLDINETERFEEFLSKIGKKRKVDLFVLTEVLSYLENWKTVLKSISGYAEYIMVSLFIPEDPIGFVKSDKDLVAEIEKYFEIIEDISFRKERCAIVFGRKHQK